MDVPMDFVQGIMFTGLIEAVGVVRSITGGAGTAGLQVDLKGLADGVRPGDSVAVNGVCLTATQINGQVARFDVSRETVDRSTLHNLRPMGKVNLERALKLGDRLGGHMVQGHVDGQAVIRSIQRDGAFWTVVFTAPADLMTGIIPKGSVAVDGISLTVANMDPQGFSIAVIPQTAQATNLVEAKPGDPVNIETDLVVRTVQRYLDAMISKDQPVTLQRLRQLGF